MINFVLIKHNEMYFNPVHISIRLYMNNFKSIAVFPIRSFDEPFYNTGLRQSRSSHTLIFFVLI